MHHPPRPLPGFKSLYWADFTLRRALHACALGVMVAAGMQWAHQPASPIMAPEEVAFEAGVAKYGTLGGIVLAVVAGIILVRRYLLVTKILRDGVIVRGLVEATDRYDMSSHDGDSTTKRGPAYVYYTSIRYTVRGADTWSRFKLLHSASIYGIVSGGETDLFVLDSMPDKPLIRAVYFWRVGMRP